MRKTFVALFGILLLAVAGVIIPVHKRPDPPPRLKMVLFCYTTNAIPPPPSALRHLYPMPSGTVIKVGRIVVLNQGARAVSIR